VLFVNRDELFSPQYTKHLAGVMRKSFGYEGCPIVLVPRARPKTIESKRRPQPARSQRSERAGRRGGHFKTSGPRRRPEKRQKQR
jgi:hypothetical protein